MTETTEHAAQPDPKPAVPDPDLFISFSAEVNANTTESLIALMAQAVNAGSKHIYLMLSTPGGTVMNGLNVYNVMRAFPITLTVHNVGNVDSIGNAIFLAGDKRHACKHSTFMFHGVGLDVNAGARLEEKALRELLGGIKADQTRIADILVERSAVTKEEAGSLFLEAQTMDADYAVSRGIVDEIRDVEIPPGVPVQALVFQR